MIFINGWTKGKFDIRFKKSIFETLDEVKELSRKVTVITHNHPEGLKGAEATSVAIYLARTGSSIKEMKST